MIEGKKGQMQASPGIFSNLIVLVVFLVVVSVGGLLAGMLYFDINIIQSTLETVNFPLPIENNATAIQLNMTDFQDILGIVVYPILNLKSTLPFLTYFMVFAFIIALGMMAYLSSKNPVFFVLHILFLLLITYFSLLLSNMYIGLMTNPFINAMMIQFTIYNKLMFYLPQVVFFTGLVFGVIAFINLMKPQGNYSGNQSQLNYGGDY
jgi:hypothetical protein